MAQPYLARNDAAAAVAVKEGERQSIAGVLAHAVILTTAAIKSISTTAHLEIVLASVAHWAVNACAYAFA
eukprot:6185729-Pleurochrysis_carterae.AAC.1